MLVGSVCIGLGRLPGPDVRHRCHRRSGNHFPAGGLPMCLDVPHDWSIEDLPAKKDAVFELPVVAGEWRFKPGDNPDWKTRELDDKDWQKVMLPDIWEHHSHYTNNNVYGWFRRHIDIPSDFKAG